MKAGVPVIRAIPVRLIGDCRMASVESGALIIVGGLGIVPGSTTTGPPANDIAARPA